MGAAEIQSLWDVNDLARYLKIKPSTIYKKVHKGELPKHKIGGLLRFVKAEIDECLLSGSSSRPKVSSQSRFQSARARLRSLTTEHSENTNLTPSQNEGDR